MLSQKFSRLIKFGNEYKPTDIDCSRECKIEAVTNSGNCSFITYETKKRGIGLPIRMLIKFPTNNLHDRLEREVIVLKKLRDHFKVVPEFSQYFMKLSEYFIAPGDTYSLFLNPIESETIYQCIAFEAIRNPITLDKKLDNLNNQYEELVELKKKGDQSYVSTLFKYEEEVLTFLDSLNKFYKAILKLSKNTGFVHNDLHSFNILCKENCLYLIDYGRSYININDSDRYDSICEELGKDSVFNRPLDNCKKDILLNDRWVKKPTSLGKYDAILTDLGGLSMYILKKSYNIFKILNVGKVVNNRWIRQNRNGKSYDIERPSNNIDHPTKYYYIMESFYWIQKIQRLLTNLDGDELSFGWKELFTDYDDDDTRSMMTSGGTVFPAIFNFIFSDKMAGGGYQDINKKYNLNLELDEINDIDEELNWGLTPVNPSGGIMQGNDHRRSVVVASQQNLDEKGDNDRIKDIVVKNFDKYPIKDEKDWTEILEDKMNFDSITEKQINNKYNSIQSIRFKIPYRYEISIPNDKGKIGYDFGNNIIRANSRIENLVYGGYNNKNRKYIYLTEDPKHKSRKIYTEKNGDKYFKKEKEKMYLKDFKGKYRYSN
jgi:hypothetical protein